MKTTTSRVLFWRLWSVFAVMAYMQTMMPVEEFGVLGLAVLISLALVFFSSQTTVVLLPAFVLAGALIGGVLRFVPYIVTTDLQLFGTQGSLVQIITALLLLVALLVDITTLAGFFIRVCFLFGALWGSFLGDSKIVTGWLGVLLGFWLLLKFREQRTAKHSLPATSTT
ncbi:hypothetical protein IPJ70_02625 [Candidatus Campbellbacteria bacterium]|nr:MAG: hypothetical protein IPJ70_02625 [Candidatus Campbellbacteria bacterium]